MEQFSCVIKDPAGIHARPASVIVAIASKFDCDIKLKFNDLEANLKSIMNVMALGVKQNSKITIEASGSGADEAIKEIKKALKENNLI